LTERPIAGAKVEIGQCDADGRYDNIDDGRDGQPPDENLQGHGWAVTDAAGR
jgi:protocatechuate 3,4-dioxygenase beta subunit